MPSFHRTLALALGLTLSTGSVLFASCSNVRLKSPREAKVECDAQIMVTFAQEGEPPLQAVEQTAKVRLELRRQIAPDTYVLGLRATGEDPDCSLALARLRQDSRIAAADLDVRRKPGNNP